MNLAAFDLQAVAAGRTPLYMQQQQLDLQRQQIEGQLAMQRATRAQQMQQLEETKRQHDFQMIEKLMATEKKFPSLRIVRLEGDVSTVKHVRLSIAATAALLNP